MKFRMRFVLSLMVLPLIVANSQRTEIAFGGLLLWPRLLTREIRRAEPIATEM